MGETLVGNKPGRALSFSAHANGSHPDVQLNFLPSKRAGLFSPSSSSNIIVRSDSNGEDSGGFCWSRYTKKLIAFLFAILTSNHIYICYRIYFLCLRYKSIPLLSSVSLVDLPSRALQCEASESFCYPFWWNFLLHGTRVVAFDNLGETEEIANFTTQSCNLT